MATEISFKEVCRFIKEDDPELIESVDLLLGFILIVTPIAVSVPAMLGPALGLLGVKNELTKLGKGLYKRITKKTDKDNLALQQRMEAAYGLLSFTAFLEALDSLLPDIREAIGLKGEETLELSKKAMSRMHEATEDKRPALSITDKDLTVFLPHPAEEFEDQRKLLFKLYEELSSGFLSFLNRTESWVRAEVDERKRITGIIKRLPLLSMQYFDAQYFALATKYDNFFIWSNLQEYRELRKQITRLSKQVQEYIILAERNPTKADIGLARVREFLERFPEIQDEKKPKVAALLEKFYTSQIQLPIIKDQFANPGAIPLLFPKKSEIFIPQAFKVTRHTRTHPLADEKQWENRPVRDDLGAFLLSYLSSPYSLESPLIILGHPGSGKSLLTEILAAKLLSTFYCPVRIVLREVLSDSDITSQIEQQLRKDLGISLSWADLAVELQDHPVLIIFDGYDELLKTSGQVISDFLIKLQAFQEREKAIRSPVRVIITSRITLIDKAEVPQDCTVIRLEEFDTTKQEEWVSIWNSQNGSYFTKTDIRPFVLPGATSRLTELACHPLLLLMMAIFDSDGNALRQYENLDRTQLYDKLIYRFVERERFKDPSFASEEPKDRKREIEKDIERFGAAAIGMFNRKRLYISGKELENDLDLFGLVKATKAVKGRPLSAAEDLAGSFFFVLESRAVRTIGPSDYIVDSTIEYLHNTFGEFLVADFILRKLIAIIRKPEALIDQTGFVHTQWYASLMYTPLHTRNVVLEMLGEWSPHKTRTEQLNYVQLQAGMDAILVEQITKLVLTDELALRLISCNRVNEAFPLIGLLATYSLNLILVRLALSPNGFVFEEAKFTAPEGMRVWDIITSLWCAWLPKPGLLGLPSQLQAKRSGSSILITRRSESYYTLEDTWLDALRRLSSTLADESMEKLVLSLIQTGHYSWH